MATTERGILEGKVLPELQAIASSMGVQGFQRLRKADLIGAIIAKAQGVEFVPSSTPARGRRGERPARPRPRRRGQAESGDTAAAPDQPELPGAGAVETSSNGPERRTRRRSRASADAEPAASGEAPEVEVSGNGQPASAGAPPATLTEPSSNGEVAQAAEAPSAPAAEQPAQAPAAEAGSARPPRRARPRPPGPRAPRPSQAQGEQQAQGGQSQGDQQQGGGDRGQRRDRDRDWGGGQGGGGNRWDNQQQGQGRRPAPQPQPEPQPQQPWWRRRLQRPGQRGPAGAARLPRPPAAGRRPARGQPHRHPRHPLPGRLRLPAGQRLPAGARGRLRAAVDDPPDGPAPRRRDRGHGQAAPRLREVRRPHPGRQGQRAGPRGGAQPPRLQGPDPAVPAGAAAPGAQPDRDLDPDHGSDVPDREGPARA